MSAGSDRTAEPKRTLLLGHPRSGTTLLRRLLGAHPAIASPPETHLFGACARFLHSEETSAGVDMGVLGGLSFSGFEDDEVIGRLRALAFGLMDEIAVANSAGHWVEKTAFDVFHLAGIEQLCADQVRYLGIIRHPLDVAASCVDFCDAAGTYPTVLHSYVARYPQPIEAFVHSWVDATEALMDLGSRRANRTMICRYEDLVEAPHETLQAVLGFLGETDDTSFIADALCDLEDLGFSDHKSYQVDAVHENSRERWHNLPARQVARLAPIVNPYLETCGYDRIEVADDSSVQQRRSHYGRSLAVHAAKREQG